MNILGPITATLTELRGHAEQLMVDSCTVSREDPNEPRDPLTGEPVYVPVYEGPAKRQAYESYEQTPEAGGHNFVVQRYSAHFPVASFVPEVGDRVLWTASVNDPGLVGTKDRITGLFNKSFATAQRVFVEEVVS